MLRNRTAGQKRTQDFHMSDVLAQTNQLKYDCFFCMAQETHKKNSSRSKSRNKKPGHIFLDFI